MSYTFPIAIKSFDIIDLVSDTNSLLRVYIKTRNPRSNANAFLYDSGDLSHLLASSKTIRTHKEFSVNIKPQKKAFKLKVVYDTIDSQSACPVYDMRVAMKPIENIVQEELKC